MNTYRHGEILLQQIKELPNDLKKSESNIFAKGSHGHNHSIDNGQLYSGEENQYLEAKNTSLLHTEHSPKVGDAKIEDGFYKLITQTEFTPDGLKPVVD